MACLRVERVGRFRNLRPAISRDADRTLAGVHQRWNATEMGAEQPATGAVLCVPVREGSLPRTSAGTSRTYDVSADGQRFLSAKEAVGDRTSVSARLMLVLHWTEELKRLVPPK